MSYTPTAWETGDLITADKMNKLEGGVQLANMPELPAVNASDSGKVLTVNTNGVWVPAASTGGLLTVHLDSNGVADKTTEEILNAYNSGQTVMLIDVYSSYGTLERRNILGMVQITYDEPTQDNVLAYVFVFFTTTITSESLSEYPSIGGGSDPEPGPSPV